METDEQLTLGLREFTSVLQRLMCVFWQMIKDH